MRAGTRAVDGELHRDRAEPAPSGTLVYDEGKGRRRDLRHPSDASVPTCERCAAEVRQNRKADVLADMGVGWHARVGPVPGARAYSSYENGALSTVLDDDRDVLTAVGKLDQIGPVIGPLAPRTDKDAACHIRAITIWLRPS